MPSVPTISIQEVFHFAVWYMTADSQFMSLEVSPHMTSPHLPIDFAVCAAAGIFHFISIDQKVLQTSSFGWNLTVYEFCGVWAFDP